MSERFISTASEALQSSAYDSAEIARRLAALFEGSAGGDVAHAARAPGAALRHESPERAREAIQKILDVIDYQSAVARWDDPQMRALSSSDCKMGRDGLIHIGYKNLLCLLKVLGELNGKFAAAAVAYLEFGDMDAMALLAGALKGKNPHNLGSWGGASEATDERCWRLMAPMVGKDDHERIRWLAEWIPYELTTAAVKAIARDRGIEMRVRGAGKSGGRSALAAYRARPLLELAWQIDRNLLLEIVPLVVKNPSVVGAQVPWLLSFLPWDVDQELWGEAARFRASRLQGLVVTSGGKHGKDGSSSAKLHKKVEKAEEDYKKKLSAQQSKLGVEPKAPCEHSTSLDEDLFTFAKKNYRERVAELILAGADPNKQVDDWTAIRASRASDPEIVELLIKAGADKAECQIALRYLAEDDFSADGSALWGAESARLLVQYAGASPGTLHGAARKGNLEIVEVLLDAGVDANELDAERRTALDLARSGEHVATAALLCERGGKVAAAL